MQVISDHRGSVIWYSGPHVGSIHDLTLYRDNPPPLLPNEQLLADKAYVGGGAHIVAPFKKYRQRIDPMKKAFNRVHRWYRATVEHCIGYIKRFRILGSIYRGRITHSQIHLERALNIILHICSYDNQQTPHRTHPRLYDSDDEISEVEDGEADESDNSDDDSDEDDNEDDEEDDEEEKQNDYFDESSFDPVVGTGKIIQDFRVFDIVWVYWMGDWLKGTVTKVTNRRGKLDVRLAGYNYDIVDLLPKHIRHDS